MPSILIVDDLLSIHEMLDAVIQPTGYSTAFATDGEKALARYKTEKYDVVLADIDMKPMDGIMLLRQLKAYDPNAVVIIMTAYASTESAVQALKFGAFDYLQKPFRVDDLISTLKRALEYRRYTLEKPVAEAASSGVNALTTAGGEALDLTKRLAGVSAAHKKILAQAQKLALVRTPVLLQGEPGTGKTTLAEFLHASSSAGHAPLVRIDCAHGTEEELRSGLFGPTGTEGKWIVQANGGTLLLQHIEKLPHELQHKLVAVIRAHVQSFRLICTSCADLEQLTEEGGFDDELFYRVASLPLVLPPLRDRPEDIPPIVRHFTLQVQNPTVDVKLMEFGPDALAVLKAYAWPGNIAELGQVVMKVAVETTNRLIVADQLPLRVKDLSAWPKLADYLAEREKHYMQQVLRACAGDKAKAARVLGVEIARLG